MVTLVCAPGVIQSHLLRKFLAGQLLVHLRHLRFEVGNRFVAPIDVRGVPLQQGVAHGGHLGLNAFGGQSRSLLYFSSQRQEVLALRLEHTAIARRPVPWRDDGRAQLLRLGQRFDPPGAVPVTHVVVGTVHRSVASKKDLFFGQPGEAVAVRVPDSEISQLHAVGAIVEDHQVPIEQ